MQPNVVATAAGPIEVADIGEGPAVIIVHGMPGDWSQAAPLGQDLADDHRVLLVSRPGYGRTPRATGPTWRSTAAAYSALLDQLEIDRAAVIGISGGGPSSYAFAAHERSRCSGLILCCAVHPDHQELPLLLRAFHATPGVRDLLGAIARRRAIAALRDPDALLERAMAEVNPAERQHVDADPLALERLLQFARHHVDVTADMRPFRHDVRELVRHRRAGIWLDWPSGPVVPTLILHGDADPVVDIANAHGYQALIPGAELSVLEGAGHAFLLTMRQTATPQVQQFLAARVTA